jgi:hypothetical protein
MKRRDTERNHPYANEVFSYLNIFDIQGLLKEEDVFKCGVEAYQVADFNSIRFDWLNQEEEKARFIFCAQLGVPYYIIITSETSGTYQIYDTILSNDSINYVLKYNFTKADFINWWRSQQSFNQKKAMYNASGRIEQSIIDIDLFSNSLAWGVNIDGFTYDTQTNRVVTIYEKRICTYKPPYKVDNYDPNRFFHGSATRSGDFPSWKILFELSNQFNASLLLFTFDTSDAHKVGASKIIDISQHLGIIYKDNIKPFDNIFNDNFYNLENWIMQVTN